MSLPRTGSRGFGLELLERLGHTLTPAVPGLTPLLLDVTSPLHGLAGITAPAVLTLSPDGTTPDQRTGGRTRPLARAAGSLLITHTGATGPAAFDVSSRCGRALARGSAALHADFWSLTRPDGRWSPFLGLARAPGACLPPRDAPRPPTWEEFDGQLAPLLRSREGALATALSERLPRALLLALLRAADLDPALPVKRLDAPMRNRLRLALTQADPKLTGCEGYGRAEVTSGGVLLEELSVATLESRRVAGLFCCGEVVDVTGRLGGFNFQWAWSSGFAAGRGAARAVQASS
jgi:predicted flavoprotein YhiN